MTIVLEAALAAGLCTLPKRHSSDESYIVTSTSHGSYQVASGITIEDEVIYRLNGLLGIEGITVAKTGETDFSVDVKLMRFDKETRRSVYAIGRALHEEFPNYIFDFHLIARSQMATGDAHTV